MAKFMWLIKLLFIFLISVYSNIMAAILGPGAAGRSHTEKRGK